MGDLVIVKSEVIAELDLSTLAFLLFNFLQRFAASHG